MRRKEREITDIAEKLAVIEKCKVCRLAMTDGNAPYIVPLNFGYTWENDKLCLYFHGACEGRKIDILKKNPKICFEMDCSHKLIEADNPADYSYAYESIIGEGKVEFLDDPKEKTFGLNILMRHQAGREGFTFPEEALKKTCAYKVEAVWFTGKRRPLP